MASVRVAERAVARTGNPDSAVHVAVNSTTALPAASKLSTKAQPAPSTR
jgi:hypothetical protein